ncbi:MAG: DNA repair protein RecN [Spirochaetaceae bacterium]
MLEEIAIKNYALIEDLTASFHTGFNVLTGETGTGKSIIVGALSLLLGEKGDASFIRSGAEEAEITGVLRVEGNSEVSAWLEERGITPEDGTILLRRILRASGRGASFIQSTKATRQDLRDVTSLLVDLHGQHEHQSLLTIDNHRKLLDRYAGNEDRAKTLYNEFYRLSGLRRDLEELNSSERELLREKELLEYALDEIESAQLKEGEEEELDKERRVLNQHEKLFELFSHVHMSLAEARGGALVQLRTALDALKSITEIMPELSEEYERLENGFYELEDIESVVAGKKESIQFSPERLDECQERLQQIHRLEKKYGNTIGDVLSYAEESRKKLEGMETREERRKALEQDIENLQEGVLSLARELSQRRKSAAKELEGRIEKNLRELGMPKAAFRISTSYREGKEGKHSCGPYGFDKIEFLISPNEGEPLKPLREIASGGEISRIMLAIKTVFSETDRISSLIFDEIDSGIGGEVAVAVGGHLAELGKNKQVLSITHLASIAVRADNHIRVEKEEREGRTYTGIRPLDNEERIREIARMLSGDAESSSSLSHAKELLERYNKLP